MRKCIRTRTLPQQTLNNIIFEPMFLVVWKYVRNASEIHQMFKKIIFEPMFLVVWKYAQMQQNTFLTTSDVKKYLF